MALEPPRKKRKVLRSSLVPELVGLKIFEDAEKSEVKASASGELLDEDKELWFFQVPKDVRTVPHLA